jgi:hypothetical protein
MIKPKVAVVYGPNVPGFLPKLALRAFRLLPGENRSATENPSKHFYREKYDALRLDAVRRFDLGLLILFSNAKIGTPQWTEITRGRCRLPSTLQPDYI